MSDQDEAVRDEILELRAEIDDMDRQIVRLLNSRAEKALAIRDLKPKMNWSLYDPKREEEIFANLSEANDGPLFDDNLREIYSSVLHVMKEL